MARKLPNPPTSLHFKAFSTYKPEITSSVRTIRAISVTETEPEGRDLPGREIVIRVTGEGFLYHMVRIIAGTLLEVGRGKTEPERIPEILASLDRGQAGPTAPACGLTMTEHVFCEP